MTDATYSTKWAWLKDFFVANGKTPEQLTAANEQYWRFEVTGFITETQASWPGSANYADATVQAAFLEAYKATLA